MYMKCKQHARYKVSGMSYTPVEQDIFIYISIIHQWVKNEPHVKQVMSSHKKINLMKTVHVKVLDTLDGDNIRSSLNIVDSFDDYQRRKKLRVGLRGVSPC